MRAVMKAPRPAGSPARPVAAVPRVVGVKPRVGVVRPRVVARAKPATGAGRGWLLLPLALCAVAGVVVYHFQVQGPDKTGTETAAVKSGAPSLPEPEAATTPDP